MNTVDIPARRCRVCGDTGDRATAIGEDRKPEAGDYDICFNCGALSVFTADGGVRAPTNVEREELPVEAVTVITRIKERGRLR